MSTPVLPIERVAVDADGVRAMLGAPWLSNEAIERLAKQHKLRRVPKFEPPLYSVASIKALVGRD